MTTPDSREAKVKRGSITLARSLCYEIAGPTDEDDMSGGGYGSVDIAEILSAAVEKQRTELAAQQARIDALTAELERVREDAERYRFAIKESDNVEELYAAVLNNGPDVSAINKEFDEARGKS